MLINFFTYFQHFYCKKKNNCKKVAVGAVNKKINTFSETKAK